MELVGQTVKVFRIGVEHALSGAVLGDDDLAITLRGGPLRRVSVVPWARVDRVEILTEAEVAA